MTKLTENFDFSTWEYLGTDNFGIKAYISISDKNKYSFMEINRHGFITYHN